MGGCASKPKDLDYSAAPTKDSTNSKKPEPVPEPESEVKAEVIVQENENVVGETKKEEPLIDLSEPAKEEAAKSVETLPESNTTTTTTTTTEVEPPKPIEEEAKPVAAAEEASKEEPMKEEEEVEKKEVDVAAVATEVPEQEKIITSPKSEDKSDAPLVTV